MSAIIHDDFLHSSINWADSLIYKARVKINGRWQDHNIFKTIIRDNVIRKYIYLEGETGKVEEAQLLSNDNKLLISNNYDIEKSDDGLVLTFAFSIELNVVNLGYIETNRPKDEYDGI